MVQVKRTPSITEPPKSSSSSLQKNDTKKDAISQPKEKLSYSENKLNVFWESTKSKQQETRPSLYNLMNILQPEYKENVLLLRAESELQKSLIENQLEILNTALRSFFLEQVSIEILFSNIPNGDQKQKLYTPQDKFRRMVEINPHLSLLQKEIGLDFDYV